MQALGSQAVTSVHASQSLYQLAERATNMPWTEGNQSAPSVSAFNEAAFMDTALYFSHDGRSP